MKDQIHPVLDWGTKELEDMLQTYADRTRRLPVGKMVKVVSSKKNEAIDNYLQDALDKIISTFENEIEESIRCYLWDGLYENSHNITEDLIRLGYFEETTLKKEKIKLISYILREGFKEETERRPYEKKSKFWKDKYINPIKF